MKQIYILMDNDGIIAAYDRKAAAERDAKFKQHQEEELHKRYGGMVVSQIHYFHVQAATLIEGE